MKKKVMSILLIGSIICATLTSCGETTNDANASINNTENNDASVSIEQTVLCDSNNIKATANSLKQDLFGDYCMEIDIENNSDTDIDFTVEYWTINGVNIPCVTYYPVSSGTKGNASFDIYSNQLSEYGIETINTIQLHMYYTVDGTIDGYMDSDIITTSAGADYELSIPIDTYTKFFDENGYKLYYVDISDGEYYDPDDPDSEYSTQANIWVYNDTDTPVSVYPEYVSYDGTMDYSNFTSFAVYPHSYSKIFVSAYTDLNNVSTLSFDLLGYETDSTSFSIGKDINISIN